MREGEERRVRLALALVALVGCAAIVLAAANASVYGIDCYFYLAKARSLGRLEGLVANFGGPDRRFFPGTSVALAPFHALFGEKGYVVFNLAAFAATLGVAFRLGRRVGLSDETAAWGAAIGTLSPAAIQWSAQPVSEPLATLLILAFLLLRLEARDSGRLRELVASGAALGLAAATRAEAALLAPVLAWDLAVAMRTGRVRQALLAGAVAALAPAAYLAWLLLNPDPAAPSSLYLRDISRYPVKLSAVPGNFLYQISAMYDIRFPDAATRPAALGVAILRYLTVVGALAGLARMHRSREARALLAPVLLCAGMHAFWFYQYERFAFVWAPEMALLLALLVDSARRHASSLLSDRALRALGAALGLASLVAGVGQGRGHNVDLAHNEGAVDFRTEAAAFSGDERCRAGVVTWPKPHFAYHIDRPVYFDAPDADFVRADFPPGGFEAFSARTHVRCIATVEPPAAWMAAAGVAPARAASAVIEKVGVAWKIVLGEGS